MEEERTGVKKEKNVIEEEHYDIKDIIPEDIEKKTRDGDIESCKKAYQEQKLQTIKDEEDYKTQFFRRKKKRIERNKRRR
jgi:hypothetical protein